jgi:MFS family permease
VINWDLDLNLRNNLNSLEIYLKSELTLDPPRHVVAQSGTNIMNDILISDISSARWRGFAIAISFFPFLFTPWIAAFIVDDVVSGIGWRWGIAMFCFLMPFASSFVIGTLLFYQRKSTKMGLVVRKKITVYEFCSQADLGGMILLSGGFAMLLLPFTLASTSTGKWSTPWLDAMLALGIVFLIALPIYEKFVAKNPVLPIHYFKNLTIMMAALLIATDSLGFSCTHTYIYSWAVIARDFTPRIATFYIYTNGVTQTLSGIIAGLVMAKTQKYKWLTVAAIILRLIGYGLMIRLRGSNNTVAEVFIVQLIQGLGSGVIQMTTLVCAQIVVPHSQLAQITAIMIMCSILGSSIGASIAGGIYTGTFKEQLRKELGSGASQTLIDTLFDSITGVVPAFGSPERTAIDDAYSNVMRHVTLSLVAN